LETIAWGSPTLLTQLVGRLFLVQCSKEAEQSLRQGSEWDYTQERQSLQVWSLEEASRIMRRRESWESIWTSVVLTLPSVVLLLMMVIVYLFGLHSKP